MGRRKKFYGKKGGAEVTTTSTRHKAKTPGLEDVVFTFGKAKDAAMFETTKGEMVKYVGVQSWRGAADAALALETLVKLNYVEPAKPAPPAKTRTVTSTGKDGGVGKVEQAITADELAKKIFAKPKRSLMLM